ncbi:glycerophosphoryl diester phosphodiesterase membrane domain-containing protein [Actinomycetospora chibensis]|uniref:Glycerophosphoryl diester phosphodiesterase membrane domain-containing protein n=1 Tax=Actinomycetospora chibensis TaxID=663606 RepID=A0ABV9RDU6_9PSEU|nr:glycerophosphoryl diester phosphodiesterase membrane domain-containing protein [Actinomycetospora chibensis]MDD7925670.1 glycerophosphoryl diester phosphodiesterase membrane domain-containing protein [Actinomycetospora chibensis]
MSGPSSDENDEPREARADEPTPPRGTPGPDTSVPAWDPSEGSAGTAGTSGGAGGSAPPSSGFASPAEGSAGQGTSGYGAPGYGAPGYGASGNQGYGNQGYGGQVPGGPGFGGQGGQGYGGQAPGYGGQAPGYGGQAPGSPGPGYGPAGFGGGPGPGPGFGQAPKPGIVPLRPLGLGEVLDGALGYIRAHPRVVLGASAIVAVISQIVQVVLQLVVTSSAEGLGGSPDLAQVTGLVAGAGVTGFVGAIITLVATAVLTGVLMVVISRSVLGAPVDAGEVWRAARPRVPGVLGVAVLVALIALGILVVGAVPGLLLLAVDGVLGGVVIGIGVLAAIVVVVWLSVSWSLATPAYVLEGVGVTEALRRSWFLVTGRFWPVFGIQLLGGIIAAVIAAVIALPFQFLGTALGVATSNGDPASITSLPVLLISAVGAIIATTLTTPFQAGVTGLLYVDQRMRREGFDIELQRAAVGGGGTGGGGGR